jgi:enolase
MNADQLCDLFEDMIKKYPVISIEDPFDQDDFEAYFYI